jgi:hypothetical protein
MPASGYSPPSAGLLNHDQATPRNGHAAASAALTQFLCSEAKNSGANWACAICSLNLIACYSGTGSGWSFSGMFQARSVAGRSNPQQLSR